MLHSSLTKNQAKLPYLASILLTLWFISACNTTVGSPESLQHAERLKPTGEPVTFDAGRYKDFADYIEQMRQHLSAHKVYLNQDEMEAELAAAMPFILTPESVDAAAGCTTHSNPTRGIVLFHGLSDTPAAMKDLAHEFAQRCFVSYSMLLPGHGARAAELLEVSSDDWLSAAQFAVELLKEEVDQVYVGGFSLGGLIALQSALLDPEISAVFAFSPAFALHRSLYLDQTIWLRHLVDWVDTDPQEDPWRFESMPFNALAETQLLTKLVRNQLKQQPFTTPVFIAQSPDDAIVDAAMNQDLFEHYMEHEANRLISYENTTTRRTTDGRIVRYPSVILEKNIVTYSHQAVHVSPDNPHYGEHGEYRNCQINEVNTSDTEVRHCRMAEKPYWGEIYGNALKHIDTGSKVPLARLTFNPQFSELMHELDQFLADISF